jgi:hypothetical protein
VWARNSNYREIAIQQFHLGSPSFLPAARWIDGWH